jgi:hypothetical protein
MIQLKPKMKFRIPQLFNLKLRYGMMIITFELLSLDIPLFIKFT